VRATLKFLEESFKVKAEIWRLNDIDSKDERKLQELIFANQASSSVKCFQSKRIQAATTRIHCTLLMVLLVSEKLFTLILV
jgi:hypothetical protein